MIVLIFISFGQEMQLFFFHQETFPKNEEVQKCIRKDHKK